MVRADLLTAYPVRGVVPHKARQLGQGIVVSESELAQPICLKLLSAHTDNTEAKPSRNVGGKMVSTGNNQPNIRRFFGPRTRKITPIARDVTDADALEARRLSLHTRLTNARKGPNAFQKNPVSKPNLEGVKQQSLIHGAAFAPTSNTKHI